MAVKTECRTRLKDRIARVLLNSPRGDLSKYRVAKLAGAGYPWTYKLLRRLEDAGLVEGTRVVDTGGLVSWWRRWRLSFDHRDYMVKRPLSLLAGSGLQHAATTYLAERMVQDYLFTSRVDVYVRGEDMARWHEIIVEDGLVGGGNFRLLFGDDHVFYKSFSAGGVAVVSMPQIIADLYDTGAACTEAADMLLERVKDGAV